MAVMTLITLLIAVIILQGCILSAFLLFVPPGSFESPEKKLTESQEQRWLINDMSKAFLADGTIHLTNYIDDRPSRRNKERQIEIYDVNNKFLWAGEQEQNPYTYLQWPDYGNLSQVLIRRYMLEMQIITPQLSRTLVIPVVNSEDEILQRWRYEPGRDYFVGFDSQGKKIGYIGSNGFAESQSDVRPFGRFEYMTAWRQKDVPSPWLLWGVENRLYQINFKDAVVETITELKDDTIEKIALMNWGDIEPEKSEYRQQMHVLTEKEKHILLLKNPNRKLTINIPNEWLEYNLRWDRDIRIVALNDKIFLQYYGTNQEPPPRDLRLLNKWYEQVRVKSHKVWTELHNLEQDGSLKLVNRFEWVRPPLIEKVASSNEWNNLFTKVRNYVTTVSAPMYNIAWLLGSHWSDTEFQFYQNWVGPYRDMAQFLAEFQSSKMTWNWAIGGLLLCATFWHAWPRRTSWGRLVFWLVFVAAFNLAGFLTYLALNHVTVIRCAFCGKKRGLERIDCPACGAELPLPERRETDLILVGQSNS